MNQSSFTSNIRALNTKKISVDSVSSDKSPNKAKAETVNFQEKHSSFFEDLSSTKLKQINAFKQVDLCLNEREFKKIKFHKNKITAMTNVVSYNNSVTSTSNLVAGSSNGFIKVFDSMAEKQKQFLNVGNGYSVTALGQIGNSQQVSIATSDLFIQIYNTTLATCNSKFSAQVS